MTVNKTVCLPLSLMSEVVAAMGQRSLSAVLREALTLWLRQQQRRAA